MLTRLQLQCASEDCSRGMQACSNLPGRALGLTWLFHASSTSRGCRVSHTAQPGSSPPGWRQAGQALPQGSVPLLVPFNCPLHSPGSLEEERNEEEEGNPSTQETELCSRLSRVGRTQKAERSLEQSQQQECALSLPENCQPFPGNGAHPFPQPWPRGVPDLLCPQKSQPRCAAVAVNRPILMHITPNITTGGTLPLPRNPSRHQLQSTATPGPPAACREAGLGCFSIGRASGFSSIPAAQ